VVDVVELLVLVVEVEVELEVVVDPLLGAVVVVVLEVIAGVTDVGLLVFPVATVATCCCTNGSLLWKLEYASVGATRTGSWLASASDCAVVDTRACRRLLVVDESPPPRPMHPARSTAEPATTIAAERRCRCLCSLIFSSSPISRARS
jgi:hypothetical protein